jgi:hypothetical protein
MRHPRSSSRPSAQCVAQVGDQVRPITGSNARARVQVGDNHSSGTPFRGRLALPGTMLIGVARLSLPSDWVTAKYSAVQVRDDGAICSSQLDPPHICAVLRDLGRGA